MARVREASLFAPDLEIYFLKLAPKELVRRTYLLVVVVFSVPEHDVIDHNLTFR